MLHTLGDLQAPDFAQDNAQSVKEPQFYSGRKKDASMSVLETGSGRSPGQTAATPSTPWCGPLRGASLRRLDTGELAVRGALRSVSPGS